MAEPASYCSWLIDSLCFTQSEWAAWFQGGATVATFAVAMVFQAKTERKAARQKAQSDRQLLNEKVAHAEQQQLNAEAQLAAAERARRLRAKAVAVSMRADLLNLESAIDVIAEGMYREAPRDAFDEMSPHLEIRKRAIDALDLLEAAEIVLKAMDGAHTIHNFLSACRDAEKFEARDFKFLHDTSVKLRPDVVAAREAVDTIASGEASSGQQRDHAASAKS